jgi:N6-L-threonylcarbamoyladenine synthase
MNNSDKNMLGNQDRFGYCLALETSCDDTAIAVLKYPLGASFINLCKYTVVISSKVATQIDTHAEFGGVVPEIGARLHATNILSVYQSVINQVLEQEKISLEQFYSGLNILAVTTNPGLMSALKVGLEQAKILQYFINKNYNLDLEVTGVNHLHGHVASCFLEQSSIVNNGFDSFFPHLHLLVSGGNSQILYLKSFLDFEIIGKTLDDAAGECFDKTARMVGFAYPGGVSLAKTAALDEGNYFDLHRGMLKTVSYDFSFSGLKTQVRYHAQDFQKFNGSGFEFEKLLDANQKNFLAQKSLAEVIETNDSNLIYIKKMCISVQTVVIEQLYRKFKKAYQDYKPVSIGLSGGVSANLLLRKKITLINPSKPALIPLLKYTGDNAAMIGFCAILSSSCNTSLNHKSQEL